MLVLSLLLLLQPLSLPLLEGDGYDLVWPQQAVRCWYLKDSSCPAVPAGVRPQTSSSASLTCPWAESGEVGSLLRRGRGKPSSACGALIAIKMTSPRAPSSGTDDDDLGTATCAPRSPPRYDIATPIAAHLSPPSVTSFWKKRCNEY